ncbi:MAG: hypothetical protein ACQERO_04630 [Bacteroidota bacterium]
MFARLFGILTALTLLPAIAYSQSLEQDLSRAGSIYSGIGFGMPVQQNSSHTNGMGLSGVSTSSPFAPNIANPALWSRSELTQAQVTLGLTSFSASDNFSSAENSQFTFENFQFVFPLLRNQLGVSIAFSPATRSDFSRLNRGTLNNPDFSDPIDYVSTVIGAGGINRFELGLGYRLNQNFSVGYAASAHLSTLSREVTTTFSESSFQRNNQPLVVDEDITGAGFGNRFGFYAQADDALKNRDRIALSAAVTLPVSINTDRSFETFRVIEGINERISLSSDPSATEGSIKLPLEFNSGVTYYLNPYHSISAEYLFQNWNESEFSYNPTEQGYYTDRTKVGVGYQYQPFLNQESRGFFSNFRYSLGASYDDGYLTISDQEIETVMMHAGLTIPSQRNRSSIDISFNYGVRGTESSNLVKESIWGVKLSLNLAEFMFLQQRFQ